jgi:5-formyltetrahydrofolate cyclo-ligase
MEIMFDKATLRATLLARRTALTAAQCEAANTAIASHVIDWWRANPVPSLGVYWPMRNEPDVRGVYATLAGLGVQLALPVVDGPASPLRFIAWAPGEALQKDTMGVSVPLQQATCIQPAALLIPCLGFTAEGLRLGYGGGFYDRTLAVAPVPLTVGIAYAWAAVNFAAEPFDVPLGRIITELG